MTKRDGINYWVSLSEKGSVKMECGEQTSVSVTIPIDILFQLTARLLELGVAHDYVSGDILSNIHDHL